METLILIGDILCILCALGLIGVIVFLVKKVADYEVKLNYFESVMFQFERDNESLSKKLDQHIMISNKEKRKAFFQGKNSRA